MRHKLHTSSSAFWRLRARQLRHPYSPLIAELRSDVIGVTGHAARADPCIIPNAVHDSARAMCPVMSSTDLDCMIHLIERL